MVKTKIEWCDYTINPVKGLCPMACSYCYARRMYLRFKWNPEIRLSIEALEPLCEVSKRSRIFIGSTIELFGEWIKPEWMEAIMANVRFFSKHTFIFLTKQSHRLYQWEFPDNCWIGATVTNIGQLHNAIGGLCFHKAKTKFLSFEPLLERMPDNLYDGIVGWCSWIIIGQQTPVSARTEPKIEWIREIVEAADRAGVKVFLKNNLEPLGLPFDSLYYTQYETGNGPEYRLRQEMPE